MIAPFLCKTSLARCIIVNAVLQYLGDAKRFKLVGECGNCGTTYSNTNLPSFGFATSEVE